MAELKEELQVPDVWLWLRGLGQNCMSFLFYFDLKTSNNAADWWELIYRLSLQQGHSSPLWEPGGSVKWDSTEHPARARAALLRPSVAALAHEDKAPVCTQRDPEWSLEDTEVANCV